MKTRTVNSLLQRLAALVITITFFCAQIFAQGGNAPVRTNSKITYHNGPVMQGTSNVYLIWYGNWYIGNDAWTRAVIRDLVLNLGGTSYFQINAGYPDQNGISPGGGLIYSGEFADPSYSKGSDLTAGAIQSIVSDVIAYLEFADPAGIYIVLTASDVHARVAGFCQLNGAPHHGAFNWNGTQVKYALVGDPRRCPSVAAPHLPFPGLTPNDDFAADGMANMIAAVLSTTITNPAGTGWFDRNGFENATKCQGIFGTTYPASNGSPANIRLGTRDFLLQHNWVNARKGYCALVTPTPQ